MREGFPSYPLSKELTTPTGYSRAQREKGRAVNNSRPARVRARFTVRLREADLGTERFIDVEDGTKTSNDHTQREPDSPNLAGNYGVYPGRGGTDGDYLIDIDIDDYDGEHDTTEVDSLPPTFSVESPHGGEHRYYAVEGNPVSELRSEFGVRNPVPTWGEIRVENGYVVGPGSELDSCDKEWHDCSDPTEGSYSISEDRPIATLGVAELLEVVSVDPQYSSSASNQLQLGDY